MKATSVTSKGQVTIPVAVRSALGLEPHDRVVFEVDRQGRTAILRRLESMADLYGTVEPRQRPEDFQGLRVDFENGVAEEVRNEA